MGRQMRPYNRVVPVVLLLVLAAWILACGGSPGTTATTAKKSSTSVAATTTTALVAFDPLSTFRAKDPFIPKVISTTTTTKGTSGTTQPGTSTSTSQSTTTTRASTTSTTGYPTQTTTAGHYLKLLSVSLANGVPVCTFEVDRVVYQDKRAGDTVSTSWGQVKVLSISTQNQAVTFLHGSETRTLSVGQQVAK